MIFFYQVRVAIFIAGLCLFANASVAVNECGRTPDKIGKVYY
jgi:hypothetical protein